MGFESVTDEKIAELVTMRKKVTDPNARKSDKSGHDQYNYTVRAENGEEFQLYLRQNKAIEDDFSCGLSWIMPSGELLTLRRYNGPSHPHRNHLENERIPFKAHIHRASERYIQANKKPDGFAEESKDFRTLNGALHCLMNECNISGLRTEPDMPSLF